MPLALSAETVSAGVPPLLQSSGAAAKEGAPTSWIGTPLACSPASRMSAVAIGPHVYVLSAKDAQLARALPAPSLIRGSATVTREASSRRPTEPVSTCTPSIVWQFDVPGAQIVTLV